MALLPGRQNSQKISWVESFERRWVECLLKGQTSELALLSTPDFRLITFVGEILSLEDFISGIASRRLVIDEIEVVDLDIRIHAQTALVTRTWKMKMNFFGRIFDGVAVQSGLWLEQPVGWKCALIHATDARLRDSWKQLTSRPSN